MSTTSEKIKVMQHFEDGGEVEVKLKSGDEWSLVSTDNPFWAWDCVDYRIKPKSVDDFDWSDAPEWANLIAVDRNGIAHCFSQTKLLKDNKEWFIHGPKTKFEIVGEGYDASDWQNSLRKRPSEKVKFDRLPENGILVGGSDYSIHDYNQNRRINQLQKAVEKLMEKP